MPPRPKTRRIDIRVEKPVRISELARHLDVHIGTIRNWYERGCYPDGLYAAGDDKRVQLETVMIGGVRHTTMEAYYRFVTSLNEGGRV